jgi:glycosyltransferase involved in cell wall biosynthesis
MRDLVLLILAAIGAHRIWNFEAVFHGLKNWLLPKLQATPWRRRWLLNPILCHTCNIWWIGALVVSLHLFIGGPYVETFIAATAAYAPVRLALWIYQFAEPYLAKRFTIAPPAPPTHAPVVRPPSNLGAIPTPLRNTVISDSGTPPPPPALTAEDGSCPTCDEKRAALVVRQGAILSYKRRIVLMTSLANFNPSYSLSTAITDQARMLARDTGLLVQIWVHEGTDLTAAPRFPANVEILPIVPAVLWRDDTIDQAVADRLASVFRQYLIRLGNATIITHDLLFQASYATLTAAIWQLAALPAFGWLHCCHSAASTVRPTGGDAVRNRTTLPHGHRLLCLNDADRPYLAAYYDTSPANVLVCPNARDVITFGHFDRNAASIVRGFGLHLADVVQTYPVSATRLEPKGVEKIVDVFGQLSKMGMNCRLVLATAHANGDREKTALVNLRNRAIAAGLPTNHLAITSEIFPELAGEGVSQATIKDLQSVSNLFLFPTISEACSLVLAEAAIAGCMLVTNASLHTTATAICPEQVLSFKFGSHRSPEDQAPASRVAEKIRDALLANPINCSRRAALRQFSYEQVGRTLRDVVEQVPYVSANAP